MRNSYTILVGNPKEIATFEELGVDGRLILK